MKKFSQNIVAASLGAALALGGFYAISDFQKKTTNDPIIVSESPKIQLSKNDFLGPSHAPGPLGILFRDIFP